LTPRDFAFNPPRVQNRKRPVPYCVPRPRSFEFYHHTAAKDLEQAPKWAQGHAYIAGDHEVFIVQRDHAIMVMQPDDFHRDFVSLPNVHEMRPPRKLTEMES
jgi:hypothetical protein